MASKARITVEDESYVARKEMAYSCQRRGQPHKITGRSPTKRITFRAQKSLLDQREERVDIGGFRNRSEAVRTATSTAMDHTGLECNSGYDLEQVSLSTHLIALGGAKRCSVARGSLCRSFGRIIL